ncbi:hypothetical protein [Olleya sp. R77988]
MDKLGQEKTLQILEKSKTILLIDDSIDIIKKKILIREVKNLPNRPI